MEHRLRWRLISSVYQLRVQTWKLAGHESQPHFIEPIRVRVPQISEGGFMKPLAFQFPFPTPPLALHGVILLKDNPWLALNFYLSVRVRCIPFRNLKRGLKFFPSLSTRSSALVNFFTFFADILVNSFAHISIANTFYFF